MTLLERVEDIREEVIQLRRTIHQNPELAFQERNTTELIRNYLETLDIETAPNGSKTGVIGLLRGAKPGPVLALRADIDALKLTEKTELPFASRQEGVCHACGHDLHTAVLLGTAKLLKGYQAELCGTVKFLFQPAEEGLGGARSMIQNGALENPRPQYILACHTWPEMPGGSIGVRKGAMLGAADTFKITVLGKGGHAAHPHKGIDPVVTAAHIITQLQTISSRRVAPVDPVVVTVGCLSAGTVENIIPNEAVMEGTVRTQNPDTRKQVAEMITQLAEGTARAMGADAKVEYHWGIGPTMCDPELVDQISEAVTEVMGAAKLLQVPVPSMGAEDFACYLEEIPGALFRIGTYDERPESHLALHNPSTLFSEEAIPAGMAAMVGSVFKISGSNMDALLKENECRDAIDLPSSGCGSDALPSGG